jgi:hypothetical protein
MRNAGLLKRARFMPLPMPVGYISSNFVMGPDGRASFREVKGRNDGPTISRAKKIAGSWIFCEQHHGALNRP